MDLDQQYQPTRRSSPAGQPARRRPGQQNGYVAQPSAQHGQGEWQRPANPRRRRRRHPYAHLVKPGLILLGVLLLLIIAIVDMVSFRIIVDANQSCTIEAGSGAQPQLEAKVKGGLWGFSWGAKTELAEGTDLSKVGTHEVTWNVSGTAFVLCIPRTITTTVTQTVQVTDTQAPVITLVEGTTEPIYPGATYDDPGFSATDNCDGDITHLVTTTREGDRVIYSVTDSSGNTATAERTISLVEGVELNGKTIYLTFDDGPGQYTEQLLDVLAKYNVKVTFFVVGTDYIHLIERIAAEGHTVALHSYSHRLKQIYQSEDKYYADLELLQDELVKYTGQRSNLLRFPGGSSNQLSDYNPGIMTRMSKSVQERGYVYFDWNVDSFDAGGASTPEQVFKNVKKGCQKYEESVVLQHDIKKYSVEAVEEILQWGLENGYTFLPLQEDSPTCHHKISN